MIEAVLALIMSYILTRPVYAVEYPKPIEKPFIALEHDGSYIPTPEPIVEKKKTPQDLVAAEFGYNSVMWHIARCESNFRQFEPDGFSNQPVLSFRDF